MTETPWWRAASSKDWMAAQRRFSARRTRGPSGNEKSEMRSRASTAVRPACLRGSIAPPAFAKLLLLRARPGAAAAGFCAAARFACRHLAAGPACFGQPDRNGLLAARHFLAGAAAAQRAFLALVHRPFDLGLRFLSITA